MKQLPATALCAGECCVHYSPLLLHRAESTGLNLICSLVKRYSLLVLLPVPPPAPLLPPGCTCSTTSEPSGPCSRLPAEGGAKNNDGLNF